MLEASQPAGVAARPHHTESASAGPDRADGDYVLGVGAAGFDRLQVSEEAYGSATPKLIEALRQARPQIWPQDPVQMAVVACGSGSQLKTLRQLVGPDGRLICSDISLQQIDGAHTQAARLGLDHVEFETLDITQAPAPSQYDVVYARFVLVHLQAPDVALANMWRMVRPGGLLLSEEHNADGIKAEPPCPAVDRAKEMLLALGCARGVDYTLGKSTSALFDKAHVPLGGVTCTNFSYFGGQPKKLFEMSLREGAQAYIGADLISQDDMQALLGELGAFTDRDDTRMFMGDFVQTWARKPDL